MKWLTKFLSRTRASTGIEKTNNNPKTPSEVPASIIEPTTETTPDTIPDPPKPTAVIKTYRVAGISYRTENLMKLARYNPYFEYTKKELIDEVSENERIYEYDFYPKIVELIPEPDNPEDPRAIKIVVDNEHIGYIKKGSCAHVHKLLKENRIEKTSCEIAGGKYKILFYDDYEEKYTLEKSSVEFFATLTIKELQ